MGGPFYTRLAYTSMMRSDSGRALYRALTEIITSDRVAFFSSSLSFFYTWVYVYTAHGAQSNSMPPFSSVTWCTVDSSFFLAEEVAAIDDCYCALVTRDIHTESNKE